MEDPDLSTSHASAVRAGLSTRTALRATHVNSLRNTNMHGIQSPGRAPTGQTGQRVRAAARLEAPLKHEFEPIPLAPKTINFQLLLSSAGQHRARLPLRIRVGCHDGPDKIVETVKSFYGLYEGEGVSFQDHNDVAVTAHYDSVPNNATIFVRIIPEPLELHENGPRMIAAGSPRKPRLEEPFQMLPPLPYTRPSSRTAHKCTTSPPSGRNRRDGPARVQPQLKTKTSSMGELDHDIGNGHSDSDAGSVSVSSSRRAKSDHLASADISVDNIVEGGRRKRAKFESSELPLFIPPQIPLSASLSSVSPQRKIVQPAFASPVPGQYNVNYTYLPSPQSYGHGDGSSVNGGSNSHFHQPGQIYGARLRDRRSGTYSHPRLSGGSNPGLLPTPDATVGSVISDEDVALQLMRLGDVSNYSHGRTSTSTLDDAQSGKADAASSVDDSDDDADAIPNTSMMPPKRKANRVPSAQEATRSRTTLHDTDDAATSEEDSDNYIDESFSRARSDNASYDRIQRPANAKAQKPRPGSFGVSGAPRLAPITVDKARHKSSVIVPPSPLSLPAASSRKESFGSVSTSTYLLGMDDEDLSSKPRCQRCRKSKKGCDRQRPCQRCKDAGIGVEGCVSEEEGNGRKGRYGRHMGVPVLKELDETSASPDRLATAPQHFLPQNTMMAGDRKRKR